MLKCSHICRPQYCRVGDVNHRPCMLKFWTTLKGKPVGSGRVWDSGVSPVLASQQRKGACFEGTVASETLEMRMGSTNTHTSTKLSPKVNKAMAFQKLLSFHLHESLLSNPSLHILSSVWQRGGEKEWERKRERWLDFWLACKLFGQIQEDVESPLIPNLSTFFSSVSIPSSTTFHQSALTQLLP